MSDEEKALVSRAERIIDEIQRQIDKRQYLNAASAALELNKVLLGALSLVLKETRG